MTLIKSKPTSPGQRFKVKVVNPELHKGKPHAALIKKSKKTTHKIIGINNKSSK